MFWILGGVIVREVFWDSGKCFGFWEVFLDSGKCFWILGSALDSGKCFVPVGHHMYGIILISVVCTDLTALARKLPSHT